MKGMKVIVSSALFLSTASFAPLTAAVRLDDAEVGFRLHLGLPRQKGMDVSDREMDSLAVTTNGTVVTAVWKGHPVLGKDFAATAVFTRTGEGWTYSFSWRGPSPSRLPVEEVSFPDVSVPRTAESGVLHSRAHGMGVIRRPNWGAISPSEPFVEGAMRNFQFIALLDEKTTGWYVDARDGKARVKRAYAYGDDRADGDLRVRMGITYGVPATAENACAFTLPWQGVITPFHGGWWEAAAVYRPWARQQSWYRNALARKRSPKALRLREIGLWAWNRGPSTEVAPPIERFAEETGAACALDWYWWHTPSYDTSYPGFWPPREGVEAFRDTVARLRERGVYVMAYVNGISQDMDDAGWADGGDDEGVMDHDLRVNGHAFNVYTRHRLAPMCGEAVRFQARLAEQVGHLASAGLDAVYLDQISCAAAGVRCWNPRHRHAPGDSDAVQELYQGYVRRVRDRNPRLALSSEECSEAYLDLFDSFISLFGPSYERCGIGVGPEFEAVPAWNALYHGAAACFGTYSLLDGVPPWDALWPTERRWKAEDERDWHALFPDQFPVEFARTVVWGNQPTVHAFRLSHATDPRYAADYRFMKETVKFYLAHRDFLYDGELLAPGTLSCATKRVAFLKRGIYSPAGSFATVEQPALPTVFHSVWRAPDGRTAAVLVNWSGDEQPWRLACRQGTASGSLPPRAWSAVPLDD